MSDDHKVDPVDPFLAEYQPSELRIACEFLTTWLPFLSRDLCDNCTHILSDRIRFLDPERAFSHEGTRPDENLNTASPNGRELRQVNDNQDDNCDTYSLGSWKDGDETNSVGNEVAESIQEPHSSASPSSGAPGPRMSWADMAQEDELEEEEGEDEEDEEEIQPTRRLVNVNASTGKLTVSKVVEDKPKLSREQREYIRFKNVKRKKDFICLERVNGKIVNIVDGLELHTGIFSAAEQKRIVDLVYELQEMGKSGEFGDRTYSDPKKWMRGKGRVAIQFGCCYNYAIDQNGIPPGILQTETADPFPPLFKVIIRRLIRWHVLPPTCVPDSCIVNIYEEGDCIPPHIDNHDFVRPFCTVSFVSECNVVFGTNLEVKGPGDFAGPISVPLPVGSVLVLNGNNADVAKHCISAVPTKRISITFRRMDESKRPVGYGQEPDLLGIQPLSYETGKTERLGPPRSDREMRRQSFRRGGSPRYHGSGERYETHSGPPDSSFSRPRPTDRRWARVRVNPGG